MEDIIEKRRAQLRAEVDACYARLYGLTCDELRYTPTGVDPKEVYGEDFPGETLRVLNEKGIKQFGEAPQSEETSRERSKRSEWRHGIK